ncbi:hypothetical protein A0K93_02015 [Corynebacterium sp. BCW_4722]|nr:hypothetical protein A0K93_02015 [Corynebacterium sp. BCW_4722]
MSPKKSASAISRAAAIALAAGMVTVPQAYAQEVKTTEMKVVMGCNLQIKQSDVPRVFRGLLGGAEGVYNGGSTKYNMIRFAPSVTAPTEAEKGKQFDYVINLGKVGAPAQIALASVQSADQMNVWIDLPANATVDEIQLTGGDQNVTYQYDKANNRIRFFKEGGADVSKWTEAGENQWVHGGLKANREKVNGIDQFVVDFPQITLKMTPTGAPGEEIAPFLDRTDPKEFDSKAFAQLYANANAVGQNANAFVRCGLSETDSTGGDNTQEKSDLFPAVKIIEAKKTEAETTTPTAKAPVTITKGDKLPDAKAQLNGVPANATAKWTTNHTEIGDNQPGEIQVTYADGSTDTVKITVNVKRALTQAEKYEPKAKTDKIVYYQDQKLGEGEFAAKASVANVADLPADAKYAWKYPADKIGENLTGTIVVTYSDGSVDEVTRPVAVRPARTQADFNDPQPIVEPRLKYTLGDPDPDPRERIQDFGKLPEGTTAAWTSERGKVGPNLTGIITVTYPDGSKDEVRLPVDVFAPYAPVADPNPTEVTVGADIADDDAKAQIANADAAPEGTTFEWKTKPTTTEAGDVTGVVTVKVPNKDAVDVTVDYTVIAADDNTWRPQVTTEIQEVERDAEIADDDAKALVTNLNDAPEGATVAWKTKPETSKAGATTGVITITVGEGDDAKSVDRTVRYTVTETFEPKAQEGLTVEIGTEINDDAAAAIANVAGAPYGATYEWVTKPDTTKVGETTGTVKVSIPGQGDTVTSVDVEVTYQVTSSFEPKKNDTAANVVYGTDTDKWGADEAAAQIQNRIEAPAGTTYEWVTKPDTTKEGKQAGQIKVTVPGHTDEEKKTFTVDVEVNVTDAPVEIVPFKPVAAEGLKAMQGHVVKEIHARESIANKDDAPEGTTFTWKEKPDTQIPGEGKKGTVIVKEPGQDPVEVEITYTIEERKVETPKPETPTPENPTPETPKPETPKPETPKPETPAPTPEIQDGKLKFTNEDGASIFRPGSQINLVREDGQKVTVIADENGAFPVPEGLANVQTVTFSGPGNFEEVTYTVDLEKKTVKKNMTTAEIAGTVIGAVLGTVGLLGSVVQLSGIAKFNTDLQKQLGIYNPQIAKQVEQAMPAVSGVLGLAGLGLVIGLLVPKSDDKVNVKLGETEFRFAGYTFPKNQ